MLGGMSRKWGRAVLDQGIKGSTRRVLHAAANPLALAARIHLQPSPERASSKGRRTHTDWVVNAVVSCAGSYPQFEMGASGGRRQARPVPALATRLRIMQEPEVTQPGSTT